MIAGINRGGNLGVDVYYSGTVAAAREAVICGIPAVAVSQLVRPGGGEDWGRRARWARAVLAGLLFPEGAHGRVGVEGAERVGGSAGADDTGAFAGGAMDSILVGQTRRAVAGAALPAAAARHAPLWNVNLPHLAGEQAPGAVEVAAVSIDPLPLDYDYVVSALGSERLVYVNRYHARAAAAGSDVGVVFGGGIAVSRLGV